MVLVWRGEWEAKCGENSNHLGFSQKHRFGQLIYCSHKYDDDYVKHTLCVVRTAKQRRETCACVYTPKCSIRMFYLSVYTYFFFQFSQTLPSNGQKAEHWAAPRQILFEHFCFRRSARCSTNCQCLFTLSSVRPGSVRYIHITYVHEMTTKSFMCMVNVDLPSANTSWAPNHIRKQIKCEIPNLMKFGLPGYIPTYTRTKV